MAKNVVIVESPAKAKTIEKILGKDFKVTSSYGHIRELDKGDKGVDKENGFQPSYIISDDKKAKVKELKKLVKGAEVWLATDEDREGEAISWHLCEVLGLDETTTKRIVFHEITKPAILKAVENPRKVNKDLVLAQQARRIIDRLVGFGISPILWRKVAGGAKSAGRVQSVAVRLIVEREKEIMAFESTSFFRVSALFNVKDENGKNILMKAELAKKLQSEKEAQEFVEACKGATFSIDKLEVKPAKKKPTAPFTTSTLQQDASRKYGFSVSRTMGVAQKLYEAGKITYMRTDSVNLSQTALDAATAEIKDKYGDRFSMPRVYKTKSKDAQEAHEAIRPTDFAIKEAGTSQEQKKLYSLIWMRAIASQMADAELERTTARIKISTLDEQLTAKGEVLKFEGFLKVYRESVDEDLQENQDESKLLPPLSVGQELDLNQMTGTEGFTRPPGRFTEATLVKQMEEKGIGRPSTYAPTISTIQKRQYVIRETREGKPRDFKVLMLKDGKITTEVDTIKNYGAISGRLMPTDKGKVVTQFLMQHFGRILDYNFTASIEEEFDIIAQGDLLWNEMIKNFYGPFNKDVESCMENAERVSGERKLGTDPKTGRQVIARLGRYGPMVQIGHVDDEDKPKFAKLRHDQSIETISFDEAMVLFQLPRSLGEYEEKEVKAAIGRFGPYIMHNSKFVSIKPEDGDPYTILLDKAIELIEAKRKADAEKLIQTFEEDETIQVLNGRWGPYIKAGKKNVKIPKELKEKAKDLSFQEVQELIENAPPPRRRAPRK